MTRDEFLNVVSETEAKLLPMPERSFDFGHIDDIRGVKEKLDAITSIEIWHVGPLSELMDDLLQMTNLDSLRLACCPNIGQTGSEWEGVSKLKLLKRLTMHDYGVLTNEALVEISQLPELRILKINGEMLSDKLDFSVLGKLKSLRCLELNVEKRPGLWSEDLDFIQSLPELEILLLGENEHLDLSCFNVPESVKYLQVPSYAVKEMRSRIGHRCEVVAGQTLFSKDPYRFLRPDAREAQEEKDKLEARRIAALKRRIANVKSAMEQLMSEPLIPELGKGHIVQMNAHLLELEKILKGEDGNVRSEKQI